MIPKDPRGQGFKDSRELSKKYKKQVFSAGNLDLIEKDVSGKLKKGS